MVFEYPSASTTLSTPPMIMYTDVTGPTLVPTVGGFESGKTSPNLTVSKSL